MSSKLGGANKKNDHDDDHDGQPREKQERKNSDVQEEIPHHWWFHKDSDYQQAKTLSASERRKAFYEEAEKSFEKAEMLSEF